MSEHDTEYDPDALPRSTNLELALLSEAEDADDYRDLWGTILDDEVFQKLDETVAANQAAVDDVEADVGSLQDRTSGLSEDGTEADLEMVHTEELLTETDEAPVHRFETHEDPDWGFGDRTTLITRPGVDDLSAGQHYLTLDEGMSIARRYLDENGDPEGMSEFLTTFEDTTKIENSVPGGDLIIQTYNGGVGRIMARDGDGGVDDSRVIVAKWTADGDPITWSFSDNLSGVNFEDVPLRITSGPSGGFSDRMQMRWMPYSAGMVETYHDDIKIEQLQYSQIDGDEGACIVQETSRLRHSVYDSPPSSPATGDEVIQSGNNWDPAGTGQEEKVVFLNGSWTQVS